MLVNINGSILMAVVTPTWWINLLKLFFVFSCNSHNLIHKLHWNVLKSVYQPTIQFQLKNNLWGQRTFLISGARFISFSTNPLSHMISEHLYNFLSNSNIVKLLKLGTTRKSKTHPFINLQTMQRDYSISNYTREATWLAFKSFHSIFQSNFKVFNPRAYVVYSLLVLQGGNKLPAKLID